MNKEELLAFDEFFFSLSENEQKNYGILYKRKFYINESNLLCLKDKVSQGLYWINVPIPNKSFVKISGIIYKITINGNYKELEPL